MRFLLGARAVASFKMPAHAGLDAEGASGRHRTPANRESGGNAGLPVLVQTSDVVGADRGTWVHEDAPVSVFDHDCLAGGPNACEGGSHPRAAISALLDPRGAAHRAVRVLLARLDRPQRSPRPAASVRERARSPRGGTALGQCDRDTIAEFAATESGSPRLVRSRSRRAARRARRTNPSSAPAAAPASLWANARADRN